MEPEAAADDQADAGVHLLDASVREFVGDRGLDPEAVSADRAGELDERREPAAAGPREPGVEELERGGGGEAVDLAQLLLEQVGAVQPLVDLLDLGELELLSVGQISRGSSTARRARP